MRARMRANADMTLGVSMSESVSMALAAHIGKFDAHRTIGDGEQARDRGEAAAGRDARGHAGGDEASEA